MANNKIIDHTNFYLYTTEYVVKIKLTSEIGKKILNWSLS